MQKSILYINEQNYNYPKCFVCHQPIYPWEEHIFNYHLKCLILVKKTKKTLTFRIPNGGTIVVPINYKFQKVFKIEGNKKVHVQHNKPKN